MEEVHEVFVPGENDYRDEGEYRGGRSLKKNGYRGRKYKQRFNEHRYAWTPDGIMLNVELSRDLVSCLSDIGKQQASEGDHGHMSLYQVIREACREYAVAHGDYDGGESEGSV